LLFFLLSIQIIALQEKNKVEFKRDCSKDGKKENDDNDIDQNLIWQGWVKYFHYNNNTHFERPNAFFQNNEYFAQRIFWKLENQSDEYGLLRIPSRHSFFLVLYNNSINLYTTRVNIFKTSYDSIKIDHINLVPEDDKYKGGIKDLGDFEEGKCIEIKATIPMRFKKKF